jgi:tetratricopeptide (TPR) repeat protein
MKVRRVSFAFVSAAFLAASATISGTAYASPVEDNTALVRKAFATMQTGNARGAIGDYSDAIASDTLEPEMLANALLNRGLAYQQVAEQEKALADYSSALALNVMAPSLRSTALYNRGLVYQKLNNVPKSVEDFTAALLINPEFSQAFYGRANALRDSGQLLFALSDYERALRFKHPDAASVHYGSAATYIALKRPLDAKRELNEALLINPDFGQARAQLVMLGDQNADSGFAAADPILTGSVSAFTGGTVAKKPSLNAAVDLPPELEASNLKSATKIILERLPDEQQVASLDEAQVPLAQNEKIVAIEEVPAIPVRKPAAAKVVAVEKISDEKIVDAPVVAEQQATPVVSGWTVQIASAGSEDAAWSTWKKMQSRFKVLQSQKPNVVKADLGAKGVFYRIRLGGYDAQDAAKAACSKLKSKGVSCYISKVGG